MLRTGVLRPLWILLGVLLVAMGVWCIWSPAQTLHSMILLLGAVMLVAGIADIAAFWRWHARLIGTGWILMDGLLSILLSLLLLFHNWVLSAAFPFVFGMWVLFSGVSKIVHSFELCRFGVRGWGWFTAFGIILALFGLLSFIEPFTAVAALGILIGTAFLLQGLLAIAKGLLAARFIRR